MIISHKYEFIFIKTHKTAGTSIEIFLSQHCGEDDIVTPIIPHVEPHTPRNYKGIWNPIPEISSNRRYSIHGGFIDLLKRKKFYNHIPAIAVRSRIPKDVWKTYFKFCVERNPWDKTLSHYHMVNDLAGGSITFDEYINEGSFCIDHKMYCDLSGNLLVDKVIKYESLTDELYQVFNRLNIPFERTLGVRAKSDHRKYRKPYREIFSLEQKMIIETAFSKEIELQGYTF